MAAILKSTRGIDSRWAACLQRHFPYSDKELGDALLIVLAYVVKGAPPVWQENKEMDSKGRGDIQKTFKRDHGELASVVTVYLAWADIPKRERRRWCQQNSINHTSLAEVQEEVLVLKREMQLMSKRQSLRSAAEVHSSKDGNILLRLAELLMEVFPDCFYAKWHTKQNYLNCITGKSKLVDFSDACLFEEFNIKLPNYILCLPNVTSRDIEDDFNPASEVCISLVVPESITLDCGGSSFGERFPKVQPHMAVRVTLPCMGDAVVLQLAGNLGAKEELQTAIREACSKPDMLLSVDVQEPEVSGSGWKLKIHCPAMYERRVAKLMAEKVRVVMENLESNAESVLFGDPEKKLRLLVGAGGHVQVAANGHHLVLVHLIRPEQQGSETGKLPSDEVVTSMLKEYGKICEVERTGGFPEETLWGAVWFEFRMSAIRAYEEAGQHELPGGFKMKLAHVDTNTPLYCLDFQWYKVQVVKNQLQLYFLNEKDMNKFKRLRRNSENVKSEFDYDELKATLISTGQGKIYWDDSYDEHRERAFPKFTNYSHHLQYTAGEEDLPGLRKEFPKEVDYFEDPDMLDVKFEAPKPGEVVIRGKMRSFCSSGLIEAEHNMCFAEDNQVVGGQFALGDHLYLKFTVPKEAYKKVEAEVKANSRSKKLRLLREGRANGYNQEEANQEENGGEPNNGPPNQNQLGDNAEPNIVQDNPNVPMDDGDQNHRQGNMNLPLNNDFPNDRPGNPPQGDGDQVDRRDIPVPPDPPEHNPIPPNPPENNPIPPNPAQANPQPAIRIPQAVLINGHLVAHFPGEPLRLPPEIAAQDEAERQALGPVSRYRPLRAENHPTGDLVDVTLDVLEEWEFDNYRVVVQLMKPNIVQVRGDLLAFLLTADTKTNDPNFVRIMSDTDTFIQIMKQKSEVHIYGTLDNVATARERIKRWSPKLGGRATPSKLGRTRRASRCLSNCLEIGMCSLCQNEVKGSAFCLSVCGHPYCLPCFRDLVMKALETKDFPITCNAANCSRPVLIVDIEAVFVHYNLSMTDLYLASIQTMDTLQPCLTPGCSMKYHPCKSENPAKVHRFDCPMCKAAWCMSCKVPYHERYTCRAYKTVQAVDAETQEWLDGNKELRRLCPQCSKRIEPDRFTRNWLHCWNCNHDLCLKCMTCTLYLPEVTHICPPEDGE